MYYFLYLQLLLIIMLLITFVLLIKKKWRTSLYMFSSMVILFLFIYFALTSNSGLELIWGYKNVPLTFTENPVSIDGELDEKEWNLQKPRLFLLNAWMKEEGAGLTDIAPAIQFLRDEENIYFGFLFDSGIDTLEFIPPEKLNINLRLNPHNSKLSHFRQAFAPYANTGEPSGHTFGGYRKNPAETEYAFSSNVTGGIWTFECAIPLSKLMNDGEKYLLYKYTFVNKMDEGEVGCYPAPDEKYLDYFEIR